MSEEPAPRTRHLMQSLRGSTGRWRRASTPSPGRPRGRNHAPHWPGHFPVPWAYDKSRFCVFSGSRITTGHSPLQMLTPVVKGGISRQRGLFATALRVKRRPCLPRLPPDMCATNMGLLFNLDPRGDLLSSQDESCSCTQPVSLLQVLLGTLAGEE